MTASWSLAGKCRGTRRVERAVLIHKISRRDDRRRGKAIEVIYSSAQVGRGCTRVTVPRRERPEGSTRPPEP